MADKLTPFDFLNSINEKKKYLFEGCIADDSGEAADLDSKLSIHFTTD